MNNRTLRIWVLSLYVAAIALVGFVHSTVANLALQPSNTEISQKNSAAQTQYLIAGQIFTICKNGSQTPDDGDSSKPHMVCAACVLASSFALAPPQIGDVFVIRSNFERIAVSHALVFIADELRTAFPARAPPALA